MAMTAMGRCCDGIMQGCCDWTATDTPGPYWDTLIRSKGFIDMQLHWRKPDVTGTQVGGEEGPPERERQREQPEKQRHAWRQPRQPEFPPPGVASPSTPQLPVQEVRTEPVVIAPVVDVDSDDADGDRKGCASGVTVFDSDESGANLWVLAEPEMVKDMARISAVEATATKVHKVDEQKMTATSKKKVAKVSFLRQPGKGTEVEGKEEDKTRFIEPLAQLMVDCKVIALGTFLPRMKRS